MIFVQIIPHSSGFEHCPSRSNVKVDEISEGNLKIATQFDLK